MFLSVMARLLGSSSQNPITRSATITKRELVAIVTTASTAFIFCPEPLRPFRDVGVVLFLAWLAHTLHAIWESIPTWLMDIVNHAYARNENLHDQDGLTLERAMTVATEQLSEAASRIRAAAVDLWHVIRAALLKALQQAMEFLKPPQVEDNAPPSAPQPTQWYSILVRTPAVHEYGPISDHLPRRTITPEAMPWQSHSTSCIPVMVPSLNFRTHLAFCLIQKTVWESRSLTLFQKLRDGSYSDIRGQNAWHEGASWTENGVREIIGIENLGLADAGDDPINMCQQYFALLREDWKYMNIWWNDIDFALLLGFLVVGHKAAAKLTIASGGLAAPATGPLFVAACATAMGCGIAGAAISEGEKAKWCRRVQACHDLVGRFPQLRAVFDENME